MIKFRSDKTFEAPSVEADNKFTAAASERPMFQKSQSTNNP